MNTNCVQTRKPSRSNVVKVVAGLIIVLSVLGIVVMSTILMQKPAPAPPVRLFIVLMLANLVVNIVLGVQIIRMRLWAYYTWLVMNGLGIFTAVVYNNGRPSVPAVALFLLMLAGNRNYIAMCRGEDGSEVDRLAA